MNWNAIFLPLTLGVVGFGAAAQAAELQKTSCSLVLPDEEIVTAYERAATQNVLAAVNPKVFFGYFCVCANGQAFGYGNTFPSLDGHQMSDALLFLGQSDVAMANFDYVRKFQRSNGQLPLAIFPANAGQMIGPIPTKVDANGGFYKHWVPGDPLRALAGPTYIQNADVIYRYTLDHQWLLKELPSINRAADYLASLTTNEGAVGGAGYYVERPTRVEYDGVAQCHAADALRRAAALNSSVGNHAIARRYQILASRINVYFRSHFWVKNQFAEYIHPTHGAITKHGLTDVDWSAIAMGMASPRQIIVLWPRLKDEKRFYYGGMPTGIATLPETYEDWEFDTGPGDRHDLAAMGRVWYLECWARAQMGDSKGLVNSIRKVCQVGKQSGYYWQERYTANGPHGLAQYCEYPANLIRIVQRFLLGVEFGLDGTLTLAPTAPEDFWNAGFGQTLTWRARTLAYRMHRDRMTGDYSGRTSQRLCVNLSVSLQKATPTMTVGGHSAEVAIKGDTLVMLLPAAPAEHPCHFEIEAARTLNKQDQ